ncbi:MAG: 4'-phosphopantetheinyl transferase superfamily protein [Gemmatimonadota bacterium]|nr:4'-phosphopantetheinyl transferase superfamily protein [Gemmatimonadota bacterium]
MSIRVKVSARKSEDGAARAAAKRAVAALLGVGVDRVVLVPRRAGPPSPWVRDGAGRSHRAKAAVSLSHRDGRAIAAASRSSIAIGVDLEPAETMDPAHARYFLSPRERADASAPSLVTRWVIKEAAWKALRCARDTPLAALELIFDSAGELCATALRGVRRPARARLLEPWPGYIAAVVAMRSGT